MISDVFWLLNGIVSWVRPGVAKSNKAWLICPILSSCDGKTNTKSRKVSVNPKVNWKIVIQFRSWDSSSENQFSIRPSENVQFFNITLLSLTLSAWVKRRQATLLADCAIARNHWFWHLVKNRFPRSCLVVAWFMVLVTAYFQQISVTFRSSYIHAERKKYPKYI